MQYVSDEGQYRGSVRNVVASENERYKSVTFRSRMRDAESMYADHEFRQDAQQLWKTLRGEEFSIMGVVDITLSELRPVQHHYVRELLRQVVLRHRHNRQDPSELLALEVYPSKTHFWWYGDFVKPEGELQHWVNTNECGGALYALLLPHQSTLDFCQRFGPTNPQGDSLDHEAVRRKLHIARHPDYRQDPELMLEDIALEYETRRPGLARGFRERLLALKNREIALQHFNAHLLAYREGRDHTTMKILEHCTNFYC